MMKLFSLHCDRRRFLQAALAAAVATGLATTANAAELTRETRPVNGIERVVLRSVGELEITQGADEALVVEAEPRLLSRITTTVSQGTLTIDTAGGNFQTQQPL